MRDLFLFKMQLGLIAHVLPFAAPANPKMLALRGNTIRRGFKNFNQIGFKIPPSFFIGFYADLVPGNYSGDKNNFALLRFHHSLSSGGNINDLKVVVSLRNKFFCHVAKIGLFFYSFHRKMVNRCKEIDLF